jgi:hypothetical protein
MNRLGTCFFLALVLVGCGAGNSDEAAVVAVFHRQASAVNAEDLDAYVATLDPSAAGVQENKDTTKDLFDQYRLNMWVEEANILSHSKNEANVATIINTKKVEGSGSFRNNRTTARHVLRKVGEDWKVVSTAVEKVEFLP